MKVKIYALIASRRPEGYQNGKALFLEAFAAGEANFKLVIETAWMAGLVSPAVTVGAPSQADVTDQQRAP